MEEVFNAIKAKILATGQFETVEEFRNQANTSDEEYPFPTPAVLISFRVDFDKTKRKRGRVDYRQAGLMLIDVRVYQSAILSNGYSLCNTVYKALQELSGSSFSQLQRNIFEQNTSEGFYFEVLQTFECTYVDNNLPDIFGEFELVPNTDIEITEN